MSEKLCLQWNDFQENVKAAFGSLRRDVDFTDVTLACEDGYQVEAHRVILTTSSPFFQSLLKRNKHAQSHPIIFMRGMKSEDLDAIIDFLYFGEANVHQESLDSFLAVAEELKLKGLTGQQSDKEETDSNSVTADAKEFKNAAKKMAKRISDHNITTKDETADLETYTPQINVVALPATSVFSAELQELEERVVSMMEKSEKVVTLGKSKRKVFICKVCGKEGQDTDIKRHIESFHLEGVSIPCNLCDKACRSRKGLIEHKARNHRYHI